MYSKFSELSLKRIYHTSKENKYFQLGMKWFKKVNSLQGKPTGDNHNFFLPMVPVTQATRHGQVIFMNCSPLKPS